MRTSSTTKTPDGVTWYYEQEGSGPHIVLVPDGLGDCHLLDKLMSPIAQQGFTVTTFDMPGMSRSADAPSESYHDVTPETLAKYIIGLLDHLGIQTATFWGCSSGGAAVLALAANHPDRVRNALPHEVPTSKADFFVGLAQRDDETIIKAAEEIAATTFVGDAEAWAGLGDKCRARLRGNYRRWLRGYGPIPRPWSDAELTRSRVDWSVSAAMPMGKFFDNVVTAVRLGIEVTVLPGRHLLYVTEPEEVAGYIVRMARKYL